MAKLKHILSFILLETLLTSGERILSSPTVTNWGVWHDFEYCPQGTHVMGMQLKTEAYLGLFSDDSALNGVQFFCDVFESRNESGHNPIVSKADSWGHWGENYWCNGVATGFQLRSEKNQGPVSDDTAANNLRLFCNGRKLDFKEGDGLDFGDWTVDQHCSKKEAFCGISTQVFTDHGSGDETAMDGLKVKCCDIPDPAAICVPTDKWELVIECDNLEAISPTTCSYEKKLGTTNSTYFSENHYEVVETYTNIGFSLGGGLPFLSANFGLNIGESTVTGFNWTSTNSEVWHEEVTTKVEFQVPPRVKSQLFQIYGKCGIYAARATRFKKVDTEVTSAGYFVQSVSYFDD